MVVTSFSEYEHLCLQVPLNIQRNAKVCDYQISSVFKPCWCIITLIYLSFVITDAICSNGSYMIQAITHTTKWRKYQEIQSFNSWRKPHISFPWATYMVYIVHVFLRHYAGALLRHTLSGLRRHDPNWCPNAKEALSRHQPPCWHDYTRAM